MKLRTSLVHSDRTPVKELSIQRGDSGLGFRRLRHLDESNTAGLARVPVHDDRDGFDGSMCCKNISQLFICHCDIKVPYKNVGHQFISWPLIFANVLLEPEAIFKRRSREIAFRKALRVQTG